MPRTRKPKEPQPPVSEGEDAEPAAENRPSQLDQLRAALSDAPAAREEPAEEVPETGDAAPQPEEEPETGVAAPAHMDEPVEPVAAAAAAEPEAEATSETTPPSAWVPPPAYPPPAPPPGPGAARQTITSAGSSSGLALGLVLVVVGVFFLIMRLFQIDLSTYGWPLYVIIPGLTLLIVGFVSLGTGALVPGGIVTVTGLILAAQNATGDWASWAYAWTLVVPGGAGLGLFMQGLRVHDSKQVRLGRNLMFWSALMFMIGFVIFESIFNISGQDFGIVSRAALPVLLIIIGVTLLARSMQRGRSA
jgi:hypothetical protein